MRSVLLALILAACAPTTPLPTECSPACPSGQVCLNAQCLVLADAGSDAAPDVPGVDVAVVDSPAPMDVQPDVAPEASADVQPDVPVDTAPSCTETQNDPNNCGTCGHRCGGAARCVRGGCECATSGPIEITVCAGVCVDLHADENCGGCNNRCGEGRVCMRASPVWRCMPR